MGVIELFVASSIPVLKVLLITGLGSCLALDRFNILGEDARKHINNVVFYVFNPALVSSNLAQTITYDAVKKLWFMPINILFAFIIGSVLGWLVVQFTKPPSHLRGLVIGCCSAGNLGNMFLIMIPAVCKEKGSPFGSPEVCQSYSLAYISLSMAIGAIFLWSYVYNIVRASSSRSTKESKSLYIGISTTKTSTSNLESCEEPLLPSEELRQSEDASRYALPGPRSSAKPEMTLSGKLSHKFHMLLGSTNWKTLFAPSTVAAIVGFTIGVVPVLRNLLIGGEAPLRVIQDSAMLVGDGAIPTVTLILGGNLLKGLQGSEVRKSLVFGIIAVRYVALPLCGVLIVNTAIRLGFVPHDPLYQFILLLQFAVPPAMNIGTITQLFGAGEAECSVIMLWAYSLASIALTLWSTFFLWLVA